MSRWAAVCYRCKPKIEPLCLESDGALDVVLTGNSRAEFKRFVGRHFDDAHAAECGWAAQQAKITYLRNVQERPALRVRAELEGRGKRHAIRGNYPLGLRRPSGLPCLVEVRML
jgi:hypothetical protein